MRLLEKTEYFGSGSVEGHKSHSLNFRSGLCMNSNPAIHVPGFLPASRLPCVHARCYWLIKDTIGISDAQTTTGRLTQGHPCDKRVKRLAEVLRRVPHLQEQLQNFRAPGQRSLLSSLFSSSQHIFCTPVFTLASSPFLSGMSWRGNRGLDQPR